jgi:hypothetical protein
VTGLTGLLAEIDFDTTLNVFSGGAVSDFNPFQYTFNGSIYSEVGITPTSFSHIVARRNGSGLYRLIFLNEFNTVTPVSTRATATFNGASFSTTKNPITLGSSYPGILVGGLIDQSTNTFTVLFQDLSSVPFQGVLNLDGTITRLQDFGFNDVILSKFAYIDSNKAYFNWSVRTTASDFPSLLSGASNSDPLSLVQEDVDSSLPVGNTYIQNPQTAIFNNGGDCRCSFFFAKKVGATEMHLLRSFRSAAGFWFSYTVDATFSDATVGVDTNSLFANYVGLFHGGNKFSMVAGGNLMSATFGTPAAFPVYFARGDITFHSSCSSIVGISVSVDDSMSMGDGTPSTFLGTVGSGIPIHSCPDVIVSSAFCSDIKTPNDGEISLHDCEERLYTENTQPCLETLV